MGSKWPTLAWFAPAAWALEVTSSEVSTWGELQLTSAEADRNGAYSEVNPEKS